MPLYVKFPVDESGNKFGSKVDKLYKTIEQICNFFLTLG